MARLKSEEKRAAIMDATVETVAVRGVGASTAAIAKVAGVSEGTIFTYFPTKNDLLNAVHIAGKLEVAAYIRSGFPVGGTVKHRLRHIWMRRVAWSIANPQKHRALQQIFLWSGLDKDSIERGNAGFTELWDLHREATKLGFFRDLPDDYLIATASALQDMTIEFMLRKPRHARVYNEAGLEMLWVAIANPDRIAVSNSVARARE